AVEEIFRVLKPGGRLIVMLYHRDSALYRLRFGMERRRTGKSLDQLVDEVDGVGNPKGEVYSRAEARRLLHRFDELELFTGLLQGWMLSRRVGPRLPTRLLSPFARRWGWFL